jgi:hypothetical protein
MSTTSPAEQVVDAAKDAVYVAIGLGVLAVQELQVRRHELTGWLSGRVDEAKGSIDGLQGRIEDRVKTVEDRLSAFADQAVDVATAARTEIVNRFGRSAKAA